MTNRTYRAPSAYKTEFGLYNATGKVLRFETSLSLSSRAFWLENALYYCKQQFPELIPQLRQLIGDCAPRVSADLIPLP